MINTRKLKSSISHIRRSKSLIRLWENHIIKSSSQQNKYRILKEKNIVHKNVECVEGQKGKIKPAPKGYISVYVGEQEQKFVIPAKYLSMPDFKALMDDVGEEYGYAYDGGLRIPYEEHEFEKILRICNNSCLVQKSKS